jgi:hypothetical protein
MICSSFNLTVVKWLTDWNFPGAKPLRVWREVEAPEDLKARADRDKVIGAAPSNRSPFEQWYLVSWELTLKLTDGA